MPLPLSLNLPMRHVTPWLSLGMPVAILLSVLVIVTNESGLRAAREVNARRDASVETRLAVDRVRQAVLRMESAQRGYLLTARAEYREPYDEELRQTQALLARLRALPAQAPAYRAALLQLAEAVERRLSELAEVMRLFDAGHRERAVQLTLTNIGREEMERIDDLIDPVVQQEERAYAYSALQGERVQAWRRAGLYVLVLLCLGLLLVAHRMARTHERERAAHLAALRAERDSLEGKVAERTHELSDLASHLQTVREDERSRLARELHDELGGLLTAAKLDVTRLRKRLQPTAPEIAERIDHLSQALDAGIALKRRIIEDLRPSSLTHLGLQRTLEIQCAEFAERAEIAVDARIDDLKLGDDQALAIYRIVQEALSNIARHAAARRVQVTLAAVDGGASIRVQDDGVGFDPAHSRAGAHGLAGMRFRVGSFGGTWRLTSTPGQGTCVEARLPGTAPPAASG